MPRRQAFLLIATLIAVGLILGFAWHYYGPERTAEETSQLGKDLILEGRFAECAKVRAQYSHRHPDDARGHSAVASVLIYRHRYDAAERELERALELDPELPAAYLWRATLREMRADYAAADRDYERALELADERLEGSPDDPSASYTRVMALAGQTDLDASVAAARAALERQPDDHWMRLSLASLLREDGRLDEAMAECDRILEARPRAAAALYERGTSLIDAEDTPGAIDSFTEALTINPRYVDVLLSRAWALMRQGDLSAAQNDAKKALRANRKSPRAWLVLGTIYIDTLREDNLPQGAQENLTEAWAYYYRQSDRARKALKRSIALNPNQPAAHSALAELLFPAGRVYEAREHVRTAVDLYTKAMEARQATAKDYIWRATAYLSVQDYAAARADVARAMKISNTPSERMTAEEYIDYLDEVDPGGAAGTKEKRASPIESQPEEAETEEP